jgi:hypothetical protein
MRRLLALILCLSALAVPAVLAGCGEDDDRGQQTAPGATATPTEETGVPRGYGY